MCYVFAAAVVPLLNFVSICVIGLVIIKPFTIAMNVQDD